MSALVGVLGGMGPASTVDFLHKLVRSTPARRDQDHLRTLVWSDSTIPDRTDALLHGGPDPTPKLIEGVRRLTVGGAQVIVMPCNTAHAFLPRLQAETPVPILDMVATAARAAAVGGSGGPVGLMATSGTLHSGLYQRALADHGTSAVLPTPTRQREVMAAIRSIKAGVLDSTVAAALESVALELVRSGSTTIVAACSEILLSLKPERVPVAVIDPVQATIDELLGSLCRGRRHPATGCRPSSRLLPVEGPTTA